MIKTFYGLDKKGGFKVWIIEVGNGVGSNAYIKISHGKEGGKLTKKIDVISVGKQGRSAYEQAVSEANGRIKKQTDKGYRENKEELNDLPVLPMLAGDFNKIGHRITFPCYGNEKLDGVRCMAKKKNGVVTLESRTGQPYILDHVVEQLNLLMHDDETLDGEIYAHGAQLQDITSAVKRVDTQAEIDACRKRLSKLEPVVPGTEDAWQEADTELKEAEFIHQLRANLEFYIFDVYNEKPFEDRLADLGTLQACIEQDRETYPALWAMIYDVVYSEEHLRTVLHPRAVRNGFEGYMLRNKDGLYEDGKRSADLQKFKTMIDSEFKIIDVVEDKQGNGVFVCQNDITEATFQVVMGGMAQRKDYIMYKQDYIGTWLTVAYQTRYKGTLLPQFPCGKGFREGKVVDGIFVPSY